MLDPAQTAQLRADTSDEPLLADLRAVTEPQRMALVTLLGGSAVRRPRNWIVRELGAGWTIAPTTIDALATKGLVEITSGRRARLTRRGRWYARTAAFRAADTRAADEAKAVI